MQKANPRWPFRVRRPRKGADPAFAKAMARSEFGRFYTDERELEEVRRSLRRAKATAMVSPATDKAERRSAELPRKTGKMAIWQRPSVKERRTEIAEAMARLRDGRKGRK